MTIQENIKNIIRDRKGYSFLVTLAAIVAFAVIAVPLSRWVMQTTQAVDANDKRLKNIEERIEIRSTLQDFLYQINMESDVEFQNALEKRGKKWTKTIDDKYDLTIDFGDEQKKWCVERKDGTRTCTESEHTLDPTSPERVSEYWCVLHKDTLFSSFSSSTDSTVAYNKCRRDYPDYEETFLRTLTSRNAAIQIVSKSNPLIKENLQITLFRNSDFMTRDIEVALEKYKD